MKKLDKLVAEWVMEWTVNKEASPHRWSVLPEQAELFQEWDGTDASLAPPFSTEIHAAWRVWEKMAHRKPVIRVREDNYAHVCAMYASDDEEDNEYFFSDTPGEYAITRRSVRHENNSACVAICMAALLAVGLTEADIQKLLDAQENE